MPGQKTPKNARKSTRPFSSLEWVGSGHETRALGLVWRGRPLTQKAREKGSGNQPIPEWYHSPGILGNSTLSVLLMECGLFAPLFTPCSIKAAIAKVKAAIAKVKAAIAKVLSSLLPTTTFQWNKTKNRLITRPLLPCFLGKGSATPDYVWGQEKWPSYGHVDIGVK